MVMDLNMALAMIGIGVLLQCAVLVPAEASRSNGITIDIHDEKQVMHSFGASDAWTCQFVGHDWPVSKRNAIADLLFSMDTDDKGNPKGIALSMWRFNVGAGSAEQGNNSRISSPLHRAECFRNRDGSYDWTKQEGQQWFLRAAQARGVPYFLAFTNSPPVQYTLNGIAHSDEGRSHLNIRKDAMPDFADFLTDVAEHFRKQGITFDYISPINEPQWRWEDTKQEGSPASNTEICQLTRLIAERLHDRKLPSKVVVGEAGSLDYLTSPKDNPRGDQVYAFWDPSSPCYIGAQPDFVAHAISGHSYFTTWPLAKQIKTRESLRSRIEKIDPKLSFWQTEFCILEANDEIHQGHGRDLGMDTALYVARVIHSDLTIANASHWSWWLAVSGADFKDGLVYIDKHAEDPDHPLGHDGPVLPSKTLWALGNFSRFVRPGMVRIGVTYDNHRSPLDATTGLMISAYLDKKTRRLAIVCVNCSQEDQPLSITNLGTGLRIRGNTFTTYTTSQTSDLTKGEIPADGIVIPHRSVVTLVGDAGERQLSVVSCQ